MRLDLFLKVSRLIKRRTVAKMACDNDKILVNGKICKASYEVKPNDIIRIEISEPAIEVCVINTEKKVGKQFATDMYREIN